MKTKLRAVAVRVAPARLSDADRYMPALVGEDGRIVSQVTVRMSAKRARRVAEEMFWSWQK